MMNCCKEEKANMHQGVIGEATLEAGGGMSFLGKFRAVFDFPNCRNSFEFQRLLYLQPGEEADFCKDPAMLQPFVYIQSS